jgi:hypothetical protein
VGFAALAVYGIVQHGEGLLYAIFFVTGQRESFPSLKNERRQAMERRALERRQRELDEEETSIARRIEAAGGASLAAFFGELQRLENVPEDLTEYRGFIGEAYRRWVEALPARVHGHDPPWASAVRTLEDVEGEQHPIASLDRGRQTHQRMAPWPSAAPGH